MPLGESSGRAPLGDGAGDPGPARAPLRLRPAVVAARPDEVELVLAVVAELGRPQPPGGIPRDALHVAVAVGPHERPEGVARSRAARRRHPQDLAAERALVLGERRLLRLAGRRIEVAVRAERETSAVVVHVVRDARDEHPRRAELATGRCRRVPGDGGDPVVARGRVVRVHESVVREGGRDGDAEQARLALLGDVRDDAGHGAHPGEARGGDVEPVDAEAVAGRDEDGPVR